MLIIVQPSILALRVSMKQVTRAASTRASTASEPGNTPACKHCFKSRFPSPNDTLKKTKRFRQEIDYDHFAIIGCLIDDDLVSYLRKSCSCAHAVAVLLDEGMEYLRPVSHTKLLNDSVLTRTDAGWALRQIF